MGNDGTTLYLGAFVDELVQSGLQHIVISPGSRSTPIAVLAAEHSGLKVWMQVDERSAGFFALGLAKRSRQPVALLCTSGTAAANYYPAITEANLSRVPLVVLTADRPHELRDVGAPQTIDQLGMYGSHVKWFMEMPLPEASPLLLRHARMMGSRAMTTAATVPAGAVHLNFPLREPLLPDLEHPELFQAARRAPETAYIEDWKSAWSLKKAELLQLAAELKQARRGLIIVGPRDDDELSADIVRLAELLSFPIVADPLSQLRSGQHSKEHVIDSYDAFLRLDQLVEELEPDVLLRFGAMPVSKPLLLYMNKHSQAKHIVVDEGGWRDPTLLMSSRIVANPVGLCQELASVLDTVQAEEEQERAQVVQVQVQAVQGHAEQVQAEPIHAEQVQAERAQVSSCSSQAAWLSRWQFLQQHSSQLLERSCKSFEQMEQGELFEGAVVGELQELMKEQSTLFVGNSMPIRDVDSFWRSDNKQIRIMANRGANGIDGLVSTAMGVSAVSSNTVLLLGDLSLYHDLNGLLGAKQHGLNITIVVINNDGGGIFSFLPQSQLENHFELLFGTPIGLDYEHAAKLYGGSFHRVHAWEQFRGAFRQAQESGGLHIIELPTRRDVNVALHRSIWPKLAEHLER